MQGGYAYRLCPADEPLTEACFQAHHLEFVEEKQALLFKNGSRLPIPDKSVYVSEGTSPEGSTWCGAAVGCSCSCRCSYVCVR